MRRENSKWEYRIETSLYDKSDYRSKFYKGRWDKAWIKDRARDAVANKISLYEAMWNGYTDKAEHMPKRLFKFFPFNHNSIKCIESNSVFMNNPRNFNDPFDCVLCANQNEYLKQCLIDYLTETEAVNRGVLTLEELDKIKCSYCEDSDSISIYRTFDSVVSHICYVSDTGKERKGSREIYSVLNEARIRSILLSFLTKSSSWRYENEWRLLIPIDVCKIYGNMIPFFPIKAIYMGCRMPVDNKEYVYQFAQRKGIKIYNMSMHE